MLLNDLKATSGVPENILDKLFCEIEFCILDSIYEDKLAEKDIYEADLHIGKLLLKLVDNEVKFKFIPSEEFKKSCESILIKNNPITLKKLDKNLTNKLIETYKGLF